MYWRDSTPAELHSSDGGQSVDTEQGCSACGGDCPCPQACERRMDAHNHQRREAIAIIRWFRSRA